MLAQIAFGVSMFVVICAVILILGGIAVGLGRLLFRAYFDEKRKHLMEMLKLPETYPRSKNLN